MHLGNSNPCKFILEQTEEVNEAKLSAVLKIKSANKAVRSSKGQILWQKSRIKSCELSSFVASYISFLIQSVVMDCFSGNRKGWHQNYDVNEWILIYLLIHSQWRMCIRNLDVTSPRISLKRTKGLCSDRGLCIFFDRIAIMRAKQALLLHAFYFISLPHLLPFFLVLLSFKDYNVRPKYYK